MDDTKTRKKKEPENKKGRPTLFREEILQQAERLGGFGLTEEKMAEIWGVIPDTLRKWKKKNPELKGAIEKGKQKANLTASQKLFSKVKEGNMVALIFWLTNRMPDIWRDRRAIVNNQIVTRYGTDAIKDLKENERNEIFSNLTAKLLREERKKNNGRSG